MGRETDAERLASALGRAVYETRLWLTAKMPRVVARTTDFSAARAMVSAMAAEGFAATAVDDETLVPSSKMVFARLPTMAQDGIFANGEGTDYRPWHEFAVMVRARARASFYRTTFEEDLDATTSVAHTLRAAHGWRSRPQREKIERHAAEIELLYLFPRAAGDFGAAGTPWLLTEHGVQFGSLGVPLLPSRRGNFLALCERIHRFAPDLAVHESLLDHPPPALALASARDGTDVSPEPDHLLDVAVHLCALSVVAPSAHPYR